MSESPQPTPPVDQTLSYALLSPEARRQVDHLLKMVDENVLPSWNPVFIALARAIVEREASDAALVDDALNDALSAPAAEPEYQAARGVLPMQPGDERPEDTIRRLRDTDYGPAEPCCKTPDFGDCACQGRKE